jgi:DNA-directed RNA polymerase subunit RPC12/RpoP
MPAWPDPAAQAPVPPVATYTVAAAEPPAGSVVEYKCPNCGGVVTFDAQSGKMKCGSCGSLFDPAQFSVSGADIATETVQDVQAANQTGYTDEELAHLRQYLCPACGGEIITDMTTAATHCPYCDSPTVIPAQLSGVRKPDAVLPFRVTKEQVTKALTDHVASKKLAPKLFSEKSRIDSIQGLYVPFWLFDTRLSGDISYRAQIVKTWQDSRNRYVKTDTYSVRRAGQISYERVPVDASQKIDNNYTEALEPFDYRLAVDYQPGYLLGYLAQTYDVEAAACAPRAHQREATSLRAAFRASVRGYNSVVQSGEKIKVAAEQVYYTLHPVWILNTRYADKLYTFAMNGQTGEFVGELPMSWKRLWGWFFSLTGSIGVVASVLFYFLLGAS